MSSSKTRDFPGGNRTRDIPEKEQGKPLSDLEKELDGVEFMVYSKLLQKPFNNITELRAAEDEFNKAHEAELKAKEEKKAAAKVVEDAATLRITAEIEAKKQKAEAYKHYLETCDTIDAKVNETREAENKALKDFCDKYGSFHTTLTVGNTTYNYSYEVNSYVDPFKRLIETFWF